MLAEIAAEEARAMAATLAATDVSEDAASGIMMPVGELSRLARIARTS